MAIERRDILFYLSEVQKALESDRQSYAAELPKNIGSLQFNLAWTSRNLSAIQGESAGMVRSAVREYALTEPVAIFVCSKQGILGAPKDITFIVPERKLKDSLIRYCSTARIMLPKSGRKSLIVENLMIGIRIDISDQSLSLED